MSGIDAMKIANNNPGRLYWKGLLVLVASLITPWVVAEQPPTPGVVEESVRPSYPMLQSPTPPHIELQSVTERAKFPAGGPRVMVRYFDFDGNTVFSDDQLRAVVAKDHGKALSLEEIYALADKLTAFYQEQGYSVALVTVPAQQVSDGRIRLEVMEGRVASVEINGAGNYSKARLLRHVTRTKPGALLRFDDVERDVLLLNDLPGLQVRSLITPGERYGSSDILMKAEASDWDARIHLDNHGPETIGEWRLGVAAGINNLLGSGDRLDLGMTLAESDLLRQGRIGWSHPVGYDGGSLSLFYSRTYYDVGGDFKALGIDGESEVVRAAYHYAIQRSRRQNLIWHFALSQNRGQSEMDDIPLSDARVRLAETGLALDKRGERSIVMVSARLASNLRNNEEGSKDDAVKAKLNLTASGEYFMPVDWSLYLAAQIQLSADPLPDTQQFSLGGPDSVRGFVSSTQRGDQGGLATLELRRYWRLEQSQFLMYAFADTGQVERIQPGVGMDSTDHLSAAGLGLKASFSKRYHLDLTWANATQGRDTGDDSNRYWLSLGAAF